MLPIGFQRMALCSVYPTESSRLIRREAMEWIGFVQPTVVCSRYKIRIEYVKGQNPKVFVLDPTLVCRGDFSFIPHMFDQKSLCLFRSRNRHWTPEMLITHTIVPWAKLWLYYYELWHAIGEWRGGGEHLTNSEQSSLIRNREKLAKKRRHIRTGG